MRRCYCLRRRVSTISQSCKFDKTNTSKVNYKLASAGGFSAHIDKAGYGKFKNLQHLSIMIAIDPSTVENGCLEVVEKSHRVEIPISSDNTLDSAWEAKQKWKPVELKAGMCNLFS